MGTITSLLAKHLRDVYTGGNWTTSNFKEQLKGIDCAMANRQVHGLNTIALLVFHTNYYVDAVIKVLRGQPLQAHDKFSFDLPELTTEAAWQELVQKSFAQAEEIASLIEQMPDEKLQAFIAEEKYGSWYRNIQGIIEHCHYHLGQIAVIRKMILAGE